MTFDAPVALLELQYIASALGLDVQAVPAVDVLERLPAPPGTDGRWEAAFRAAIDDLATGVTPVPVWLNPADTAPLDLTVARQWIRHERQKVIDAALMSTDVNGPRVMRRARSLEGTPIRLVVVLPAAGPWWAHPAPSVLLVALPSYLDDVAWGEALAGLAGA